MVIKPRVRGFLCTTTHPAGCAANVRPADRLRARAGARSRWPEARAGDRCLHRLRPGLAHRRRLRLRRRDPGHLLREGGHERKPGTAGWYNAAAFHAAAEEAGLYARSINGDAFSDEVKAAGHRGDPGAHGAGGSGGLQPRRAATAASAHRRGAQLDAEAHRQTDHAERHQHGQGEVQEFHLEPRRRKRSTIRLRSWAARTGSSGSRPSTRRACSPTAPRPRPIPTSVRSSPGTSTGTARSAPPSRISTGACWISASAWPPRGGDARVSVLKAVVTQASAAIPAMPIYLAILFKVMKERGTHEGCIEQIDGLFRESLYGDDAARRRGPPARRRQGTGPGGAGGGGRALGADRYGQPDELSDFAGYRREFLQLFGFEVDGVDYDADVDPVVPIPQLV
jgi:enoyl-[acyl-carrier protein] reductase/trans-2-enoyl-CoA reductase (NAD+)